MQTNTNTDTVADPKKWKIAKKRVAFKYHLLIYFLVNIFLWIMWYTNIGSIGGTKVPTDEYRFPWPLWPMLIWGIGIIYNYIETYKQKNFFVEREYQKLKSNQ